MITPLQRCFVFAALAALTGCRPDSAAQGVKLEPCRVSGYERELRCGTVSMPENPDDAAGRRIDIRFMIVDAVARNKQPDPVFVLAGGPGQAASRLIGQLMPMF